MKNPVQIFVFDFINDTDIFILYKPRDHFTSAYIAAFPLFSMTCTQPRILIFHCCLMDIRGLN